MVKSFLGPTGPGTIPAKGYAGQYSIDRAVLSSAVLPTASNAEGGMNLAVGTGGFDATNGCSFRIPLRADHAVTDVQAIWNAWYWNGAGLVNLGSFNIGAVYVEQQNGTLTPMTFAGAATGVCPAAGSMLGKASVSLAAGEQYWLRFSEWGHDSNGVALSPAGGGPGVTLAGSWTVGSKTASNGTGALANTPIIYGAPAPSWVGGTPTVATTPTLGLLGDSISNGIYDQEFNNAYPVPQTPYSWVTRWVNGGLPATRVAVTGLAVSDIILAANSRMLDMVKSCSTVLIALGANDLIRTNQTPAQMQANLQTLCTALQSLGIEVWVSTVLPMATSTDHWATLANQTTNSHNADRVTYNNFLRTKPYGITRVIEAADTVESSRNSGLWTTALGTDPVAGDGVHPLTVSHKAIASALPAPPALAAANPNASGKSRFLLAVYDTSTSTFSDQVIAGIRAAAAPSIATETSRATGAEQTLTSNLSTHTARTDNPHSVTKAQVGLGNAENTSDANKPISTATQSALDNKAPLVSGTVPAQYLPSYVDDVVEYANLAAFPATGESGKLYTALDTNKIYRWGGSAYAVVSDTVALGETTGTAYDGLKGKNATDGLATANTAIAQRKTYLMPTASKTAAYTAQPGEFVLADISASSWTLTLPPTTSKWEIGFKVRAAAAIPADGSNPATLLTVALNSSSDTMNGITNGTILARYMGRGKTLICDGAGNVHVAAGDTDATVEAQIEDIRYLRSATDITSVTDTSTTTPTPAGSGRVRNDYRVTALAAAATFAAPTGTAVDGNRLLIRIKDDGTARALTWNTIYKAVGVVIPTTTVATKTLYIGAVYNAARTTWDITAVSQEV